MENQNEVRKPMVNDRVIVYPSIAHTCKCNLECSIVAPGLLYCYQGNPDPECSGACGLRDIASRYTQYPYITLFFNRINPEPLLVGNSVTLTTSDYVSPYPDRHGELAGAWHYSPTEAMQAVCQGIRDSIDIATNMKAALKEDLEKVCRVQREGSELSNGYGAITSAWRNLFDFQSAVFAQESSMFEIRAAYDLCRIVTNRKIQNGNPNQF